MRVVLGWRGVVGRQGTVKPARGGMALTQLTAPDGVRPPRPSRLPRPAAPGPVGRSYSLRCSGSQRMLLPRHGTVRFGACDQC